MKPKLTAGREGKNLMPSKADQRAYLKKIREAADGGDILAMAAILGLARLDELLNTDKEIAMHMDSGILNLPGHGGWRGDANDQHDAILAKIRENDPQSKQLPENQ